MQIDYINENINGWTVKDIEYRIINNRKRTYIKCECDFCKKIRIVRADKRKKLKICNCQRKNSNEKDMNVDKLIIKEWEKIKDTDICSSIEDMKELFEKNGIGKFYKKNPNKMLSKDNYIFGSYDDLKKYYKEKKEFKEQKLKETKDNLNQIKIKGKIRCPNCGAYSMYINACPVCKYKYHEENKYNIYIDDNKKTIDEENNQYTEIYNHFSFFDNNVKKYVNIKDVKAIYFEFKNNLVRAGITRVEEKNLKRQAVVGDFQAIDENGRTFIIDHVFQFYGDKPMIFSNGEILDAEKIHAFNPQNTYTFIVLRKNNIVDNFILSIYRNGKMLKSIYGIEKIWGHGTNTVYYKHINGNNYFINILTFEISLCWEHDSHDEIFKNSAYILDRQKNIILYINPRMFKNSKVMFELLKNTSKMEMIDNEFEDDNTKNYKVSIEKNDYETIDIILYLLHKKTDPLTYFGNSFCVYGYPLFRILKKMIIRHEDYIVNQLDNDIKEQLKYLIDKMLTSAKNNDKYNVIAKKLLNKYSCSEPDLVLKMIKKYGICEIFNINYNALFIREENLNKYYIRERIDYIYDMIPKEEKVMWKSEYEMYLLIKHYYNDAIYQYTDDFLNGLIIDVFVPSIMTAFEYQGEQHYKEVTYFLNRTLSDRQKNDYLKKKYCEERKIDLIEWKYDELITKMVLDEKIAELCDKKKNSNN